MTVGDQALEPGLGWVATGLFCSSTALQNGTHSFPPVLRAPGPGKKTEAPGGRLGLGRPRVSGGGGSWPSVPGPRSRGGPGRSLLCPSTDWQQVGFPCRATQGTFTQMGGQPSRGPSERRAVFRLHILTSKPTDPDGQLQSSSGPTRACRSGWGAGQSPSHPPTSGSLQDFQQKCSLPLAIGK